MHSVTVEACSLWQRSRHSTDDSGQFRAPRSVDFIFDEASVVVLTAGDRERLCQHVHRRFGCVLAA